MEDDMPDMENEVIEEKKRPGKARPTFDEMQKKQ